MNMKKYGKMVLEEIKIHMKLKHKNIVKIHDVFEPTASDPYMYIVLELMEMNLEEVLC